MKHYLKVTIPLKGPKNEGEMILLHENCRVHQTKKIKEVINDIYCLDLAPSDLLPIS